MAHDIAGVPRRGAIAGGLGILALGRMARPAPAQAAEAGADPGVDAVLRAYDAQGHHRTGQLADAENADWLARQATSLGATVTFEEFEIERVEPAACHVETGDWRIPGIPMFDAAFTGPDGITGRLRTGTGTGAEIGLEAMGPLSIYQPAYERFRRSPGCRALVTVTVGGNEGLALFNAESFLHPYGVPTIQVSSLEGARLLAAAARGDTVRVVADVRRVPATVRNVVATVRGTGTGARPLVVMTPRSGWWHCASERGGGLVCWLEVLRALREHPPATDVTLVSSSGHELGHIGLDDFMARRPHLVAGGDWLHFGANIGARGSKLTLQSPQEDLRTLGTAELERAGHPAAGLSPTTQVPFGESRAIHRAGGRYLTFIGSNDLFHLREDRWPNAVDVGATRRIADAAGRIAVAMSR